MDKYSVLKSVFGHESFREGQEMLVESLLQGRDALGIMPTGAGKSMCYQIPAILMPGITIVISPLISLMKDQVASLKSAGIPAAYLNSSLTPRQITLAMERAAQRTYKIIYVAPERLDTAAFRQLSQSLPIDMVAVDEAHCVSQWGQDFRPDYLKIADYINSLPVRPVVGAFTATATDKVKDDIEKYLKLHHPMTVITGFDRPNLYFEVLNVKKKMPTLLDIVRQKKHQCGIIYCSTRKNVERVHLTLECEGYRVGRYHAGLSDEERHKAQGDFQFDRIQVMVATNAFGMGIDKSNVNYVIHFNMPKSMEAYYQEAGRAGRDGSPAECIMLYNGSDIFTAKWMIEHSPPNEGLSPIEQTRVRARDELRLERMVSYCERRKCLRKYIINYFGQHTERKCGNCSSCSGNRYVEIEE